MSDRVRMTSNTVFQNERITVFREGGPEEGAKGAAATVGDPIETDLAHARELDRLGLATPLDRQDLEGEAAPLAPHYSVSVPDLARERGVPVDQLASTIAEQALAERDAGDRHIEAIRERVRQEALEGEAEIARIRTSVEDARQVADDEMAGFRSRVEQEREAVDSQIAEFEARIQAARRAAEEAEAAAVPMTSEVDEPPAEADEATTTTAAPAAKTGKKST